MKMQHLARSAAMAAVLLSATAAMADMPKYVFFFVGDGMSSAQIQATEAYLTDHTTAARPPRPPTC